jgi:hypothetical protein
MSVLDIRNLDCRQFGAPKGPGEAGRQERTIAQATQIRSNRCEQLLQDRQRGRRLFARHDPVFGGFAPHAGTPVGDSCMTSRHWLPNCKMQMPDRRTPQLDRVGPAAAGLVARKVATSSTRAGRRGRA